MFDVTTETKLPRLNSSLQLTRGQSDEEGTPVWRLYDPVAHQYYQIGWMEFEYVSRFSLYSTYGELEVALIQETTLQPDKETFRELILFLHQNGLLQDYGDLPLNEPSKHNDSVLSELIHKYLFFSVPLFRPQSFLKATYPYVALFFQRQITLLIFILLALGVVVTLGRLDEFTHTFLDMFSLQGAATLAITFTIIKVFHELGHAYTAYKHGLEVPHMGIAFMVMYPVFYTETTAAWRLAKKRERLQIGLAGIRIELFLAAIALWVWNYTPPGIIQSISFAVIAISLLGSLLINLNPLMRFDGYFVLSDMLSIENMHQRGFACARWKLRKFLFGWKDDPPEQGNTARLRFLITFGWMTIIYRFFLFLGIAVLVYMIFPKPFGLILMIIELCWFIFRPVLSELKVWILRYNELFSHVRGKVTALCFFALLMCLFLPVQHHVTAPALYHAAEYRDVYPVYAAKVVSLNVQENEIVKEGDVLAVLESVELDKDYKAAQAMLEELEKLKMRQQTNSELMREGLQDIESEIDKQELIISSLLSQKEQLVIKAPFTGRIEDMNLYLHEERTIGLDFLMFRIIRPQQNMITAYFTEDNRERLNLNSKVDFYPQYSLLQKVAGSISNIEKTNISSIDKKELSSVYGGPIYSEIFEDAAGVKIVPRQSLYKVNFNAENISGLSQSMPGFVKIKVEAQRPAFLFFNWGYQLILPESDVI